MRLEGDMSLRNPVTPPGIDPGTVRVVVQRLNHYATPGPLFYYNANVQIVKDYHSLALGLLVLV